MLLEEKIKADLHLGHVIKITLNNETGVASSVILARLCKIIGLLWKVTCT